MASAQPQPATDPYPPPPGHPLPPGAHPPPPGRPPLRPPFLPPPDHPPPDHPPPPPPPPPPEYAADRPLPGVRALPEAPAAQAVPAADEVVSLPAMGGPPLPSSTHSDASPPLAQAPTEAISATAAPEQLDAPLAPGTRAAGDEASAGPVWPWVLALAVALLAWWASSRRSHRLAQEARQLSRQQRHLKSAHEQLQQHSAHLRTLSIQDPLTGVLNRQAFAAELRELTDHLSRFGRPLNLVVFDLDHFKAINDQRGHLAGDAALKLVVGIVREHLVSADLLGRFGGDEFLIACADQSLASCAQLADAIRAAVEHQAPLHDPPLPGLTLSMGVAQANADVGYQPDELFARADAALYEAKGQGRNRVVTREAVTPAPQMPGQRHL